MPENEQYEEKIDQLERQLGGVTEMLGQVLDAVGEPVTVTKESLREGVPDRQIQIDEFEDSFVFSLAVVDA